MYLNDFSVRIPEGNEQPGGYVELNHGQQYTLVLRNSRDRRCDARIEIDGKHVGTWRIHANNSISLERPVNDTGRFTFYAVGTEEARKAQLDEYSPSLGLVKVTFTPEVYRERYVVKSSGSVGWPKDIQPTWEVNTTYTASRGLSGSMAPQYRAAGGTGLSGKSNQNFYDVAALEYDYSQQTVIHLRLVLKNGDEPRPLTQYSTPVPPPVR